MRAPTPAPTRRPGLPAQTGACTTEFGGLCFLVNVALAAGLYGDFTRPLHVGLPVSPWRFLHAAGVAFFGRAFKIDPLARHLIDRMGWGMGAQALPPAPATWQLDMACIGPDAADPRPWHVLRAPGMLRVLHPAGFVLAQATDPAELQPLLAQAPGLLWHALARLPKGDPGLLGLMWPWLARRLASGLGLPAPRPALDLALRLPARVDVQDTQWRLHFSLAALPLAVRLAGLDRDPGWVPAAGCDFRFHFD